jgi:hypothetical protein
MKHFYAFKIKNMKTVNNFEVTSDNLQVLELDTSENYVQKITDVFIINFKFILFSPYRWTYFKNYLCSVYVCVGVCIYIYIYIYIFGSGIFL